MSSNWGQVGNQLTQGFEIGQKTGGKLSGLGNIIGKVADRLRSQRETGEALDLLGKTEQVKTMFDPEKRFKAKLYEKLEAGGTGEMGGATGTQGGVQIDALGNLKVVDAKDVYENQKAQEMLTQAQTSGKSIADIEMEQKGQEELRKELGKGITPDKAGLYTLADESIKNIQDIKKILFPTGEAKSFKRATAFASNVPGGSLPIVPQRFWGKAEQDVFRKMGSALSGRQLIQTGVAARPEETQKLVAQFAPSVGSNPESALAGLNELEKFYTDYKNTLKTRGLKANLQTQVKPTGQLMIDANGNRAMVYPDGTYEEMR